MVFCAIAEEAIGAVRPLEEYFRKPDLLPKGVSARWFILDCIRQFVRDGKADGFTPQVINRFREPNRCRDGQSLSRNPVSLMTAVSRSMSHSASPYFGIIIRMVWGRCRSLVLHRARGLRFARRSSRRIASDEPRFTALWYHNLAFATSSSIPTTPSLPSMIGS